MAAASALAIATTSYGGQGFQTYTHSGPRGFSIAIPRTWKVVPQDDSVLRAMISNLVKQRQMKLAAQFAEILKDPYQRGQGFLFDAFQWPTPPGPLTTDVIVKAQPLTKGVPATLGTLSAVAAYLWRSLKADKTIRVLGPVRHVRLPAGTAYEVQTVTVLDPSYKSATDTSWLYLLLGHRTLYTLEFRVATSSAAGFAPMAASIARGFRI